MQLAKKCILSLLVHVGCPFTTCALDAMIASSSLDGMVVLWSTLSLSPMRKFNEYEKYRDNNHTFPYCVHHLVALEGVSRRW